MKIETEYKLELTREEFERVQTQLTNFNYTRTSGLEDYFFDIKRFDAKGFDFTRIRVFDDNLYEKTIKKWHLKNNERVREELESKSDKKELEFLKSTKEFLSLKKIRSDYKGFVLGYHAVLSFDHVKFHDEERFFFECEINVPEEVTNTIRPKIKAWMLSNFNLTDRDEGIGMMKLVLQKSLKTL